MTTSAFEPQCHDRIGIAPLTRMAMKGGDMLQLRDELKARNGDPGAGMDLAIVEQILGNRASGLEIQRQALKLARCFRPSGYPLSPRLRVLALAAPVDMGGNTPIEFLVENADIELRVLYISPGQSLDDGVPDHDIAIVIMSDDEQAPGVLTHLGSSLADWKRPILNRPDRIVETDRDRLFTLVRTIPGLHINPTARVTRGALAGLGDGDAPPDGMTFPLIVRPSGSHAGNGLARVMAPGDVHGYLAMRIEQEFFVSPFTDYGSGDGLYRKYRIALVDGKPFACHMAISDQWAIWYLNADMAASETKRGEEASFMARFDTDFGARHAAALSDLARRLDLDYFIIDCAETKDGQLLVFEAGVAMIVHDLDPVDTFPYKPPQMRKIFGAFQEMLFRRAREDSRR